MKVCIYGAGAIGGFIGTRLAAAGECSVSAVARGATLQSLRQHGWRLRQPGGALQVPAVASEDPGELGAMDLVVVAVKAPALAEVALAIGPLLGRHTMVLPAMNGVPWWFAQSTPALAASRCAAWIPPGASVRPSMRSASSVAWCMPAPSRPSPAWSSSAWARA